MCVCVCCAVNQVMLMVQTSSLLCADADISTIIIRRGENGAGRTSFPLHCRLYATRTNVLGGVLCVINSVVCDISYHRVKLLFRMSECCLFSVCLFSRAIAICYAYAHTPLTWYFSCWIFNVSNTANVVVHWHRCFFGNLIVLLQRGAMLPPFQISIASGSE